MRSLFFAFLMLLSTQLGAAQNSQYQTGHTHDILAVKFSPSDSQLISYSWGDGRLCLWDVSSSQLLWMAKTDFIQKAYERSNLKEFYWSEDGKFIVTKSENSTYQTWDANTGKILSVSDETPNIKLVAEKTKRILVSKDYQNFYLSDSQTNERFTIPHFSRTGSVYDVSPNGQLFAEGGSWGNAAIKVTEIKTGKTWFLDGRSRGQQPLVYQPNELELRLLSEKRQRQAKWNEVKAQHDRQAALDIEKFKKLIYLTFEHFGDMTDPGEKRLVESDEPKESTTKKSAANANAIWLRLHNDSPLPIQIPTQSMYLPNPKCFYETSTGAKIFGLCDKREISIWHGLEDKAGKPLRYGFDFGSIAILLPNTSVLFAVPRVILKNDQAIRFEFTFQKENSENEIANYGTELILRFTELDLTKRQ